MKIILNVKQIRTERHMTLKQLSLKSGVSTTHISDIENGERGASLKIMVKLAKAFNLPIECLYKVKW